MIVRSRRPEREKQFERERSHRLHVERNDLTPEVEIFRSQRMGTFESQLTSRPAGPPAYASAAATPRRRRAGRCASRAVRTGGRRNARAMPSAGRRASASNARRPRLAARPIAIPAPRPAPGGATSRLSGKPTAGATPSGVHGATAPATASRPTGRPSAGPAATPRAHYDARQAAGVCIKCKTPTYGGAAYCAPCAVAKAGRRDRDRDREAEYAARRRRYAERRARGRCVECDVPSPGVDRQLPRNGSQLHDRRKRCQAQTARHARAGMNCG